MGLEHAGIERAAGGAGEQLVGVEPRALPMHMGAQPGDQRGEIAAGNAGQRVWKVLGF